MYSWGDDTNTWNKPGAYDYGSARRAYLDSIKKEAEDKGPRTYVTKKKPNLSIVDPKGKTITTESANPIIIGVDGTGSMQTWPAEIFDRLPLLYQTLSKYRPDTELSFSVIGDAAADNWPVQMTNFGKGPTLDDYLKAVKAEGGGGPGIRESYELWAYAIDKKVTTPKATSPFLIIMGDEKFYDTIKPEQVKHYLGETLQSPVDAREIWKSLATKFNMYFLRKSYPGHDEEIKSQWEEVIGPQKVIPLTDPTRVVDVAMGIIAKQWGQLGDFTNNLSARQDGKSVKTVLESLRAAPVIDTSMKSKTKLDGPSKKSVPLAEE